MKLFDPVFDTDYLPRLESALKRIYYSDEIPYIKMSKAVICTNELINEIKIIWADAGQYRYKKNEVILKLETELSTFKLKKYRNSDYPEFFNRYKDIFQDFINDLKGAEQPPKRKQTVDNLPSEEDITPESFEMKLSHSQPIKPIRWLGTAGQLIYLLELLQTPFLPMNMDLQADIRKHFVDVEGKPFKNLKQTKQNYLDNKTGKPKGAEDIEDIVEKVKKHS